jgi:hypothetical protein
MRETRLDLSTRATGTIRGVACAVASATLVFFSALSACSSDTPTAPNDEGTGGSTTFATTHFDFRLYDGLVRADVDAVVTRLKGEHRRIVDDLEVPSMPRARVEIWSNEASFYAAMLDTVGTVYVGAKGYVLGPTGLRLVMLGDPPQTAVHEFAHVVTLNINRGFANNPRWLWEAVAVYEAEEFVEPASLPYMRPGSFPTLQQLDVSFDQGHWIYQVGYVLTAYIVEIWGMDTVIALIRAHGDIHGILGITVAEFEQGWHAWLAREYF